MSEWQIDQRRNWKAQTFPIDHFIPDNSKECQYCLTEKQAEILRGIIEPLGWKTRWWSDSGTPIDKDTIEAFRDDLIRRLMMSCCGDEIPVQYRYDNAGGLEKSKDGGTTWTPAPENDVRINSPQFPPMAGPDDNDKKCLAATGGAALLKEQVGDQLTDDMSRYTLSQLITDWVGTMLESSNPFQALLTVISNQIFALVIATLRPALTDTVYDTFKCILYCRMNSAAFFSGAAWSGVRSDITAQIGGIAGVFLEHLVYLLGNGGLTNLVRAGGAAEGDCSDCAACPGCAVGNWRAGYFFGGVFADAGTIIDAGDDFITVQSFDRGDGLQVVAISVDNDSQCCFVSWEVVTAPNGSISNQGATDCETVPSYENLVTNSLLTFGDFTSLYFPAGSSVWSMKFTFSEPSPVTLD